MKISILVLLFLISLAAADPQIHEVIIIGAGMAGLRASQVLQSKGIEHIILEATDHVGGRVVPMNFAGIQVDKGASLIPNWSGATLRDLAKDLHWPSVKETMNADVLYLEGNTKDRVPLEKVEHL